MRFIALPLRLRPTTAVSPKSNVFAQRCPRPLRQEVPSRARSFFFFPPPRLFPPVAFTHRIPTVSLHFSSFPPSASCFLLIIFFPRRFFAGRLVCLLPLTLFANLHHTFTILYHSPRIVSKLMFFPIISLSSPFFRRVLLYLTHFSPLNSLPRVTTCREKRAG